MIAWTRCAWSTPACRKCAAAIAPWPNSCRPRIRRADAASHLVAQRCLMMRQPPEVVPAAITSAQVTTIRWPASFSPAPATRVHERASHAGGSLNAPGPARRTGSARSRHGLLRVVVARARNPCTRRTRSAACRRWRSPSADARARRHAAARAFPLPEINAHSSTIKRDPRQEADQRRGDHRQEHLPPGPCLCARSPTFLRPDQRVPVVVRCRRRGAAQAADQRDARTTTT